MEDERCVCVRERERKRKRGRKMKIKRRETAVISSDDNANNGYTIKGIGMVS